MKRNLAIIKKEAEIFGLLILGDGATISRCPLLNILASVKNTPVSILKIVDCQGHLSDGNKKDGTLICNKFLNHMREIDPGKKLTDIVMFGGASNVQLGGGKLKVQYSKLTVMRGVEHTVSLVFNDVSKIPILNQMIFSHKMIYNMFGSGIYHKPHSIFKSKSQEFHNINTGLFSGNKTRMAGYFMGMHRYLRIRRVLQATILSSEFISIPTNIKSTKAVKYIHDNKSWGRCYVLLNILFPCLRVLRLADSNLVGMEKVYYYSRMTKQCIEKTKSDLDYQRVFPDISSPENIWNMSDYKSDEEESISNDCTLYSENICFVISSLWNER